MKGMLDADETRLLTGALTFEERDASVVLLPDRNHGDPADHRHSGRGRGSGQPDRLLPFPGHPRRRDDRLPPPQGCP